MDQHKNRYTIHYLEDRLEVGASRDTQWDNPNCPTLPWPQVQKDVRSSCRPKVKRRPVNFSRDIIWINVESRDKTIHYASSDETVVEQ